MEVRFFQHTPRPAQICNLFDVKCIRALALKMTAGKKKNSAGSMKKHIANGIVAPVQIVLHAPANAGQLSKIIDLYLLRTAMAGLTLGQKTIERIAKDVAAYLVDISAQALSDAFALVEPSFQENFAAEVVA